MKRDRKWGGIRNDGEPDQQPLTLNINSDTENEKEPSCVEVVKNRIYFYSDIDRAQILQLNRKLREVSNELLFESQQQDRDPASIFLHINSYGGSVFAGLSAMDEILGCKIPVTTIVDGCCASAGTFLSVAGKKRIMRPNAFLLIHQISSGMWGKFRELEDDHLNNQKLMEKIKEIYTKYTKIPAKELNQILDHDIWFDAKTCLKYGIIDEIRQM
jgi:ATP-dependent Clp endopeptidase proteolytic subunit ClpP